MKDLSRVVRAGSLVLTNHVDKDMPHGYVQDMWENGEIKLKLTWGDTSILDDPNDERYSSGKHDCNFIDIVFYPTGYIRINAGKLGSSEIPYEKWRGKKGVEEAALEKAFRNPGQSVETVRPRLGRGGIDPGSPCLPGNSLISVPKGFVQVKNLKSGDSVWTADRSGHKVKAVIVQKKEKTCF